MIKNIIFDMGRVILDFIWEELYVNQGLTGKVLEGVALATVKSPLWNEFDRGIMPFEEIVDAMVKNSPEYESEIRKVLRKENFPKMIRRYSYTDDLLDSLKAAGYKLYILSNFPKETYVDENGNLTKELEYINKTDGQIISYQHQIIKPDIAIYKLLLDTYNLDPKECLFIDDKLENVEGAKAAGINSFQFISYEDMLEKLDFFGISHS